MSGAAGPSIWSIKPKKKNSAPETTADGPSSRPSTRYNKRPHSAIKDEDEDEDSDLQEIFESGRGEHSQEIARLLDKRLRKNNPATRDGPG